MNSISSGAQVTISFNKDIYVLQDTNLILIDKVIEIKAVPGKDSDPNDLNITSWNVTSKDSLLWYQFFFIEMEPRKIIIKVLF